MVCVGGPCVRDTRLIVRVFAVSLHRLAGLYGLLTGTAGEHTSGKVKRELRHLRDMGIDIHRPLTLRLLHDASPDDGCQVTNEELARTLGGVGTWVTRLWLADRQTAGLNKAVTELAHGPGPSAGDDFADFWLGRIRRLRNTRVGVPDGAAVREGIRSRRAYGGTSTRTSFAVLCALMEAEHREESPARDHLTIEHVMPQKLTDEWKRDLGDGAAEQHGAVAGPTRESHPERRCHEFRDGSRHVRGEARGVLQEPDWHDEPAREGNGVGRSGA